MRYAMAIDVAACTGCQSCVIACKAANNLPNDILWNRVETIGGSCQDLPAGTWEGGLTMDFQPVSCQHCSNPSCVAVCPTGASYVRDDGIVLIDANQCIGCGSCLTACPYDVRTLYENDLGYYVDFPVGDHDAPIHVASTVGKCVFCAHRIDRGETPACMEVCPAWARYWGDVDDPESDISKFLEGKGYERLLEGEGTEPNVYYVR